MHHYFNTEIAKEVGVNAAVILENIAHWVFRNQVSNKNHFDGHYWTYNSNAAMAELFPYMNARQVRYALDSLRKAGLILTGNYNKSRYDRTLWYTVSDYCAEKYFSEIVHSPKTTNGTGESVQPIPDINTDNKPDNISQQTDSSESDAPIPQESVRNEKTKSLWDISREITGNDPFTFPCKPTSDSEENSAAGRVKKKPLVKNLTDKKDGPSLQWMAMLNKAYDIASKESISVCIRSESHTLTSLTLTMGEAFAYWLDNALYREDAREAYLSKFLEAWQRVLCYHESDFYKRVRGADGHRCYMWQNVIAGYANNWNPGTPSERREAKAKGIFE